MWWNAQTSVRKATVCQVFLLLHSNRLKDRLKLLKKIIDCAGNKPMASFIVENKTNSGRNDSEARNRKLFSSVGYFNISDR